MPFPGVKFGAELAAYHASADVFVFPPRTDAVGPVVPKSIASDTPVPAFPVTGPLDVLQPGVMGGMHPDLRVAVAKARALDHGTCRAEALKRGWEAIASQFMHALAPINCDKAPALNEAPWENPATRA